MLHLLFTLHPKFTDIDYSELDAAYISAYIISAYNSAYIDAYIFTYISLVGMKK